MNSPLRVISLFEDLPEPTLARIEAMCAIRAYPKTVLILTQLEQTTDVFFVLSGTVRFNSYAPTGREVIFNEISTGGIFGEFAAIDGRPRSSDVIAVTDCRLARMSTKAFFALLESEGTVSVRLIQLLVEKIRGMSERVFEVSALAARERVRRELLRLAATGAQDQNCVVIRPAPTHYEIAARIGSHREAVTREVNRLEAEGVLEVHRRQLRIVDVRRLRAREDT